MKNCSFNKFTFLLFLILGLIFMSMINQTPFKTISFPSLDKLPITADLYEIAADKPSILLCHQARFSRGEYRETALALNRLGFNCMAIDQRSGDEINGVVNETAKRAVEKKLPIEYRNAEMDIKAAINFLSNKTHSKIILLGSSYSASLVLKIAAKSSDVKAVIAFSPGEYIKGVNIAHELKGLDKPMFVTSSREEAEEVTKLISNVKAKTKVQFVPSKPGDHGSKVLWERFPENEEYWNALKKFLEGLQ